jgi:hypothetical protein
LKKLVALFVLVAAFLSLNNTTFSQFYVKVGGGYSFLPVSGFQFNDKGDTTGSISYKSYGMGVQPVLGFGYYLNKNVALELNGMYLIGQKHEQTPTGATNKQYGEGIFITPGVKVVAPLKNVSLYSRMGLVVGIPKVKMETDVTSPAFTSKSEFRGGISMGLDAALGVDIKASKMMSVFIELNGMALNYAPDEFEVTEQSVGTIPAVTTFTDNNRPYFAFGNFGGKVGVSFLFGKMPKK